VTRLLALAGPSLVCLALAVALYAFSTRQERLLPPPPPADVPAELAAALLQPRDIERYARGTPERAFLAWWRAAQYDDAATAYAGLTSALRARFTPARFATELQQAAGGLTGYLPRVAGRTPSGTDAALHVDVLGFDRGRPSAVVPRVFRLRREPSGWRVSDLTYVHVKAAEGRRAVAAAAAAAR
jgi:hypothetical protein